MISSVDRKVNDGPLKPTIRPFLLFSLLVTLNRAIFFPSGVGWRAVVRSGAFSLPFFDASQRRNVHE